MERIAVLLVLVTACKKKEAEPPPPPTAASAAAHEAPAIDATPAAKLVLTRDGFGPLQRLAWDKQSENETAAVITNTLSSVLPGITTGLHFLPVPGKPDVKHGYWSVKRGDKEILQVLGKHPSGEGSISPAVLVLWIPEITTVNGVKVGDTVGELMKHNPVLYCFKDPNEPINGLVPANVTCHDKREPGIVYILDDKRRELPNSELDAATLADIPIVAIAAIPK